MAKARGRAKKNPLEEVLQHIKPSIKEEAAELRFAKSVLQRISKSCPKGVKPVLVGSVAKRTFLREKRDLDIFVLFDSRVPKQKLEPHVLRIMKRAFPSTGYQLSYAEHPYVRFHFNGRRIDLVPAYKIENASQRLSAVDRSVLHTKFIRGSLKRKQIDEVLLLKQFLLAHQLYGAEIKIGGFSGYLCELLIIRYGSFMKLLRAAAKWKEPVFIDLKKYYKGKRSIGSAVSVFGFLTVIDPTDRKRNVAAAVSKPNFRKFIKSCKQFVKKQSASVFFRKPETFEQKVTKAAKRYSVFTLSMPRPDVVDDVLWGQLHKMMKQLKAHLADFGPKTIFADDHKHIVRIAIALERHRLSPTMEIEGPPLSMKTHVQKFRKAHPRSKTIKKNKKIYVIKKRQVVKADASIRAFLEAFSSTSSHLAYPEEMVLVESA